MPDTILDGSGEQTPGRAFYPPCALAGPRPRIPTMILIGALDDWTPAADCSHKVAGWGTEGAPIEHVVYPTAHHSFYYWHLQPGMTMSGTGWNTKATQWLMRIAECGSSSSVISSQSR